jgi:hypothetical protein
LRYYVLALFMFALGALATTFKGDTRPYTAVVRLRTADGFFITVVHSRAPTEKRCGEMVDGFVKPLETACPTCTLESAECSRDLVGIDRALVEGSDLPLYRVSAAGVNIALVGPPATVRERCESIAESMVRQGLKTASCVFPKPGAPNPPVSAR